MRNQLFIKWQLILILLLELKTSFQSIAGVTYRDDFDFEERYAKVEECDPFYYHPLHLPEYCAEMFEKLIRSRMGKNKRKGKQRRKVPKKPKEDKNKHDVYSLHVPEIHVAYPQISEEGHFEPPEFVIDESSQGNPEFEWNESKEIEMETPSPYEKMISQLREDLASHPSDPTIGYVPNIGQVAIYRQPISKSSKKIIKTLTNAYKNSGRKSRKSKTNKILINPATLEKLKKRKHHRHHRKNKTKTKDKTKT